MITTDVADGIDLISHAHVNCYLIDSDEGVTLVDAGLPRMWPMVLGALVRRGRQAEDIRGLVLTHGHFDHVGFARHVHQKLGVPVFVHPQDEYLAAHPYSYQPQSNRFLYPLAHPRSLPLLGRMALAGALSIRGISDTRALTTGDPLPLPGSPVAMLAPGHTAGQCILHLPDRDTVISGDALVTLDPYTGKPGPQIVASAATKDTRQALAALDVLVDTGATTVLPGHGDPWAHGVDKAVDRARAIGEH
ncbi:putative metallo-hydrolase YflN [Corynebacterium occultum]|uniref:Putative metallo-hydrolase YflN n=1 Tax=Corynebacterium occultum TaxID=2675219 RepID=A0A6B8W9A9_9CORY|nr:MBL fold metallo-hydrolase [Corynebacterium occultum]QGU07496.1 putative metallo-hydrolase YflN [Corynebacterium occultum]